MKCPSGIKVLNLARQQLPKICGAEHSAVTKSKADQADAPGPICAASVQWPPPAPVATTSQWLPIERPASVGPPLFIRLLRLTI